MPRQKFEERWECLNCPKTHLTEQEAHDCEVSHAVTERLDRWAHYFPGFHPKDDRYTWHCVDCGLLLVTFEPVRDGHRNEPGPRHNVKVNRVHLGGLRCYECINKMKARIFAALEATETCESVGRA
jgi:hypothetical protein